MIRQITADEIDECVSVIRTSFLTVAEKFGYTEENAPRYTAFYISSERLTEQFNEHRPMFAYFDSDSDKIIGYYSLKILKDAACNLNNLCVLPEYRNRRIGTELFRHSMRIARQGGCKRMKISVIKENTPVREWYERMGAELIGTQKFDFFPFTCEYLEMDLVKAGQKNAKENRRNKRN